MPDNDQPITFPAFVMRAYFRPGDSRQHLVEHIIADIWRRVDHAHVFRVEFDDEAGTFEAMWILASADYWQRFLDEIHRESTEDVADMLEGLEQLLADAPSAEDPND